MCTLTPHFEPDFAMSGNKSIIRQFDTMSFLIDCKQALTSDGAKSSRCRVTVHVASIATSFYSSLFHAISEKDCFLSG